MNFEKKLFPNFEHLKFECGSLYHFLIWIPIFFIFNICQKILVEI